ncbi:MAG TPA: hypothetical protein VJ949_11680 [Cryomorphaceae bacterium]|nr:hypothetical protein [Cryomorphaceae bacterium]
MKAWQILFMLLIISCKSGKDLSRFNDDQISPELSEMVNRLIETDYIGTEKIGRSPEPSAAYASREALLSMASEEELLALIDHPEGEVAATAFEGLLRNRYSDLKMELLNLSKGDRTLNLIQGDVVFTMPALEYAYVNLLGNDFDSTSNQNKPIKIGLSDAEKAFIENRIMAIRQSSQNTVINKNNN